MGRIIITRGRRLCEQASCNDGDERGGDDRAVRAHGKRLQAPAHDLQAGRRGRQLRRPRDKMRTASKLRVFERGPERSHGPAAVSVEYGDSLIEMHVGARVGSRANEEIPEGSWIPL